MTPSKLNKILQGQTALARKVFEVVPIKEAWPASQIRHSLKEVIGVSLVRAMRG